MVSTPTTDPYTVTAGEEDDGGGLYVNRLLSGIYAPGSVFKLVTATAALDNMSDCFTPAVCLLRRRHNRGGVGQLPRPSRQHDPRRRATAPQRFFRPDGRRPRRRGDDPYGGEAGFQQSLFGRWNTVRDQPVRRNRRAEHRPRLVGHGTAERHGQPIPLHGADGGDRQRRPSGQPLFYREYKDLLRRSAANRPLPQRRPHDERGDGRRSCRT